MEAQNKVSDFGFGTMILFICHLFRNIELFFLLDQFCCLLHLIFQDGLKPKDTKIVQDYLEYIELKYGHFRDVKKFSQEIEKTPNKIFDRRNQIQQFLLKGLLFSLFSLFLFFFLFSLSFLFLFFFLFSFFFFHNNEQPNQILQEIQHLDYSQISHFWIPLSRFSGILKNTFFSFLFF